MNEFRRIIHIPPVRLYIEDLYELEAIIKKDLFNNDANFNIQFTIDVDYNININCFKEILDKYLSKSISRMQIDFNTREKTPNCNCK